MGPLAIVGLGLIGTSVSRAANRAWPDRPQIHVERGDSLAGVAAAEVVVLATPVDVTLDLLQRDTTPFRDALVLDTGSVKRAIVAAARSAALPRFVGGHPMAGAATSGPGDARADLFDGKPWFLIAGSDTPDALRHAQTFVEELGARPIVMHDDGAAHDRLMAAISHLPQVVASALMCVAGKAAGEDGLQLAGGGLRDTTRLADSAASMWEGILRANAGELQPLLRALGDELYRLADTLEDGAVVRQLFDEANRARAVMKGEHS